MTIQDGKGAWFWYVLAVVYVPCGLHGLFLAKVQCSLSCLDPCKLVASCVLGQSHILAFLVCVLVCPGRLNWVRLSVGPVWVRLG